MYSPVTWRRRARTVLLALLATPIGASPQVAEDPLVGIWEGILDAGTSQVRLVLHVSRDEAGTLAAALDSPDQGAVGIAATSASSQGGAFAFQFASLGAAFEGSLSEDGRALEGDFSQGPVVLTLRMERTDAPSEPERPQHPRPPFPYRVEEARIHDGGADVVLAGTLTLPEGPGPFPAAVLVSGSGPQDRDESLMGHKPFLVLADHLTRAGIAVLRYDDRGVGRSTGSFATATTDDFTTDALAAVRFLDARDDIGAVGIVGHSEGGLVAPLAASRSSTVRFVVLLAGPGLTGAEILDLQAAMINRAAGAPEEMIRANRALQGTLFDILRAEPDPERAAPLLRQALREGQPAGAPTPSPQALEAEVRQLNSPWFRFFLDYDPRPALETVRVPVLALNGELDLQVPPTANLREVREALERGGNPDVTATMLPGLNHLLQPARTGAPDEYARIRETMSPVALRAVSGWILERFGPGR